MAIVKTHFGTTSLNSFKAWLTTYAANYFSCLISSGVITCRDANSNIIMTMKESENGSGIVTTAYINSETYIATSQQYVDQINDVYSCANGILITFSSSNVPGSDYTGAIIITKTNTGKTAFILNASSSYAPARYYSGYNCVAWGDDSISAGRSFTLMNANQTQLVPFCTMAAYGESSFTPNAFFLPFCQYYSIGVGSIIIASTKYLTNGYWAIKDE